MKDEIKEILDNFKNKRFGEYELKYVDDVISRKNIKLLLDYITNLQEGNKNLLEEVENIQNQNNKLIDIKNELQEENKELKKQVEYLMSDEYLNQVKWERDFLENILNGDDK